MGRGKIARCGAIWLKLCTKLDLLMPATATSFSDEGMIVALTLGTAVRAESNRMEASAIYGNVEVAGAFRAEEGKGGFQSI